MSPSVLVPSSIALSSLLTPSLLFPQTTCLQTAFALSESTHPPEGRTSHIYDSQVPGPTPPLRTSHMGTTPTRRNSAAPTMSAPPISFTKAGRRGEHLPVLATTAPASSTRD
ncbi:hypothetical protein C8R44DRAFT_981726 [Mycena epipterygia]|nr:hypothetical protein C8R44DRAFT_981726 [Mycena epipterygia]